MGRRERGLCAALPYRVSARNSTGGSSGNANTYTMLASANHLTSQQLDFHLRSTYYDNDAAKGWMNTVTGGWSIAEAWMLELFGGWRNDQSKLLTAENSNTTWYGADMDIDLGSSIYLNLSGEHNTGGNESYNQVYSGVSWRF